MRIKTFWWGAQLFPEDDAEWRVMKNLFTDVKDDGAYDRTRGVDPAVYIREESEDEPRHITIDR